MNGRGGGREGDWHVRSPLVSSVKVQKRPSMTPVSGSMVTSKKHGRVGRPGMVDIWRRGGKKATDPCQPHSELCRRRFACRIWFVAGTYRSAEGVEETGADGGANVADGDNKALWCALERGVVREGEVRLGHADGQVVVALRLVAVNLLLRLLCWGWGWGGGGDKVGLGSFGWAG